MTRTLIAGLTLAAAATTATTANAASIWLVDLDGRDDTHANSDPGGDWNFWAEYNLDVGDTKSGIVDQDGFNALSAEITSLTNVHNRSTSGATSTTLTLAGAAVTNAVIGDGNGGSAKNWNGNVAGANNGTVEFTISGLDDSKQYTMSFLYAVGSDGFAATNYVNPTWSIGAEGVVVNGSQSVFDNANNVSSGTSGVFAPKLGGTIDITVIIPAFNRPGRHTFEAFAIEEVVPEPGSLALMGIGGLLIARRRRG